MEISRFVAMVGRSILASRWPAVAGFLLTLLLGGCMAARENSLHRAARERQYREWRYRHDLLQKETERLQQQVAEGEVEAQLLRDEAAMTASHTRDELQRLDHELDLLQKAERDLAAAKQRLAAIEQEQQPVLQAIAALQQKQQELQRLQGEQQGLDQQLAAAAAKLQELQAAATARLGELEQQQQQVAKFDQAVQQAMAAVAAAATPLVPKPPAAKPAEPKPADAKPDKPAGK